MAGLLAAVVFVTTSRPQSPHEVLAQTGDVPTFLRTAADQLEAREATSLTIPEPDQWLYTQTVSDQPDRSEPSRTEQWARVDYEQVAHRTDQADGDVEVRDVAEPGTSEEEPFSNYFDTPLDVIRFYEQLPTDDPEATLEMVDELIDDNNAVKSVPLAEAIAIGWDEEIEEGDNWFLVWRPQLLLDPESYTYRGTLRVDTERETQVTREDEAKSTVVETGMVEGPGQVP